MDGDCQELRNLNPLSTEEKLLQQYLALLIDGMN
jgi:hypothetical protein